MYRKFIALCVLASVARASVIVNVFDDVEADEDGAISASSSVEGCVESQCNNFCRRAGFRFGTCYNNRCQCTFHADFTNVGDVEDNSTPASSSVEGCVESQCNSFCRRAGFRFGTCHNNRCQCTFHTDFSGVGEVEENSIPSSSSVEGCVESRCNSLCRRAGFRFGKCHNNRCQCTFHADFTDVGDVEDNSTPASSSVEGCVESQCNSFCRRAGFRFGTCHNNRCQCTFHAHATDKSLVHQMHDQISKSCNFQACEQLCRRLGFPGGACVGDKCKCDNFEPITVDGESLTHLPHRAKSHDLESCNFQSCDQLCRRLGFPGGACVGDRCDCDNFKQDPEVFADTADEELRHSVDTKNLISLKYVLLQIRSAVKDCHTITCVDMCHRLNYAGGTCSGGPPGSCMCF